MKIMHVCHASEFPKVRAQFMLKIPDTKVCIIKKKKQQKTLQDRDNNSSEE